LGVREPKSKIEDQRFVEGGHETEGQKWLDSTEKQKRRSNLKFVTDKRTDRQTESIVDNNRLLGWARRSKISSKKRSAIAYRPRDEKTCMPKIAEMKFDVSRNLTRWPHRRQMTTQTAMTLKYRQGHRQSDHLKAVV